MKKIILLAFFMVSGVVLAQERQEIKGQILVPILEDAEGIAIYNRTTGAGTISKEDGNFSIPVAIGDTLLISALQFENFSVKIDQNIIDKGELRVIINESITELQEVIVEPNLSGDIVADVKRIRVDSVNFPTMTAAEINPYKWNFEPDSQTAPRNNTMPALYMTNGLNFANIFRTIFDTRTKSQDKFIPLDDQIRKLYDDEFFKEYLDIDRENINEFIGFAEENGLSQDILKEGKQLDLIEFLLKQSKKFKAQQNTDS